MAGANHIIQRIYFRDLPGAQLGSLRDGDAADPTGPTSKDHSGPRARSRFDSDVEMGNSIPAGRKGVQENDSPADIARLFDGQTNMFAMEYMRNGDVGIPISQPCLA